MLRHGMSGSAARLVRAGELDAGYFSARWTRRAPSRRCTRSRWPLSPTTWSRPRAGVRWSAAGAGRRSPPLPWIWTPPDSVHHRLLARKFAELDAVPNAVAEVDQEASMLDLVRSGVGLSLARDSLALRESQTHGLLLVQGLEIRTELSFVCLASRSGEPLVAAAFDAVRAAFS